MSLSFFFKLRFFSFWFFILFFLADFVSVICFGFFYLGCWCVVLVVVFEVPGMTYEREIKCRDGSFFCFVSVFLSRPGWVEKCRLVVSSRVEYIFECSPI